MGEESTILRVRLDKWLWVARLFKTRSVAADAIAHNRVRIGGQRVKASRAVHVGDCVTVEKGPYTFEVEVLGLDDRRRSAPEAAELYRESEASVAARDAIRARRRADREARLGIAGDGRPNKRQRREIMRLRDQASGDGQ